MPLKPQQQGLETELARHPAQAKERVSGSVRNPASGNKARMAEEEEDTCHLPLTTACL